MALLGPYATEAEAIAVCADFEPCCDGVGEPLDGHPDIEMVVDGGPFAGTHTLVWTVSKWVGTFGVSPVYRWELSCAAGVWTLTLFEDDVQIRTDTYELLDCDPFALTFDAAEFSADSPVTASVA